MKHRMHALWGALLFLPLMGSAQNRAQLPDTMNRFLDRLMARMTLDEKIGQLNLITGNMALTGPTLSHGNLQAVLHEQCGGVFNAFTPELARRLQEAAVTRTRMKIPLIFGLDVIHGHKTIFPIPLGMAASWDTGAIRHAARIAATEASADGVNWVYSPMVDLARDPRWGRVAEGAGEDPWLGSLIARAYVLGYQGSSLGDTNTVMACVKHFALYGGAEGGRDYNTVDMSRRRMFEDYLLPYKAALDAGAGSIMTSFNEINGVPATANHWLLTNVLRNQWHFRGFVVTDYDAIPELINHGIAGNLEQASLKAFRAGAEMDMMGFAYIGNLKSLVEQKKISLPEIDRAVRDVLAAKFKLGLFQDPFRYISEQRAKREILSPAHIAFARTMADKSIVLLKNEGGILPLKKQGTLAVIGPLANDPPDMLGPWVVANNGKNCVSMLQGIRQAVGDQARVLYAPGAFITMDSTYYKVYDPQDPVPTASQSDSLLRQAVALAGKVDVLVLALGESARMSGEASSRAHIRIPACQEKLLRALYATGKPIVLVLSNGRPLVLRWEDQHLNALVETWFLGVQAGNAVADILFGNYDPSGKITMSFPYSVGQIPIYYNHKNTGRPFDATQKFTSRYMDIPNDPLFPFGYGLSYTRFTYGPISLDHSGIPVGGSLHLKLTLTNTGEFDGTETAQLYIRDKVADITQPVKVLRGFRKVFLKKGASTTLEFTLSPQDLKIYDRHMKFREEPGPFQVFVGGNSRDVQEADFTVR